MKSLKVRGGRKDEEGLQMVERYAHLSEAHIRSAVESKKEVMFGGKKGEDVLKTVARDDEVLWRGVA